MHSRWLANVQLLHLLDFFGQVHSFWNISQKTWVFIQKYELKNWNSPWYTLGQKFKIFLNILFWNISGHCLVCFLCISYKILQSSSGICKALVKHRNCFTGNARNSTKVSWLCSWRLHKSCWRISCRFLPFIWWLYFPIYFLNYYLTFWWNTYILLGSIILYNVNNFDLIICSVVVISA